MTFWERINVSNLVLNDTENALRSWRLVYAINPNHPPILDKNNLTWQESANGPNATCPGLSSLCPRTDGCLALELGTYYNQSHEHPFENMFDRSIWLNWMENLWKLKLFNNNTKQVIVKKTNQSIT